MAGDAIEAINKDQILPIFEMHGSPCFSFNLKSRGIVFSCDSDDPATRKRELEKYCDIVKDSGTTAQYLIKFHEDPPEGKRINNNSPFIGSLNIRLTNPGEISAPAGTTQGNVQDKFYTMIMEAKLQNLDLQHQMQMKELRDEMKENKSNADNQLGLIGMIGEAGTQYPWMADIVKDTFDMLKDGLQFARHKLFKSNAMTERAAGTGSLGKIDTETKTGEETAPALMHRATKILCEFYSAQFAAELKKEDPEMAADELKRQSEALGCMEYAKDLMTLASLCQKDADKFEFAIMKLRKEVDA